MKIIKVPVTGQIELLEFEYNVLAFPNLQEATVGGDSLIERVFPRLFRMAREERVAAGKNWFVMIVDEDGISKRLPENTRASFLYGVRDHATPRTGRTS